MFCVFPPDRQRKLLSPGLGHIRCSTGVMSRTRERIQIPNRFLFNMLPSIQRLGLGLVFSKTEGGDAVSFIFGFIPLKELQVFCNGH